MPRDNVLRPLRVSNALSWRTRLGFLAVAALAVAVVWITNDLLTERYTVSTRNRAEVRQALYSGNLLSELRRNSTVPLLLSRDPALIDALNADDYLNSSRRLISLSREIDAAAILLLDDSGRVVAATDRGRLGENHRNDPYMVDALRSNGTVFTIFQMQEGSFKFSYSRRIQASGTLLGAIVVEVDLGQFERSWSGISDAVLVSDSEGTIILATEPSWRGLSEQEALAILPAPSAIRSAIRATVDWTTLPTAGLFRGDELLRLESRIPFHGWRMTSFTTYASVRQRVNGVLALEIMGFAILLACLFYLSTRRALARSLVFQKESAELRELNQALQREIAERERVEKNLQVAEQTLAQSSKLAAMGEMSASVSHELNQPLAAMKTYLAGARLLLQRRRPEEALSSFERIDELIERMGAITRELKSYARKGDEMVEPIDARVCVTSALTMIEPQPETLKARITTALPDEPVMVMADRLRLDQVLINLLRNALDATWEEEEPQIDVILTAGQSATLTVCDNGHGIENLDSLFEPFYTTKAPGEGVGLGLAISSSIVKDFGGRLTARNGTDGGAVFEVQLPLMEGGAMQAAE